MGMLSFTSLVLFPSLLHDLKGYPDSVIGTLIAPKISHQRYTNCTQCHAPVEVGTAEPVVLHLEAGAAAGGGTDLALRKQLAAKAFAHTATTAFSCAGLSAAMRIMWVTSS